MKAMMDMYQNASRALPPPVNPFEFMQGRWANPLAAGGTSGDSKSQQDLSDTRVNASEAVELKRRIEELESLLIKRVPKKSKGGPKSRRKA